MYLFVVDLNTEGIAVQTLPGQWLGAWGGDELQHGEYYIRLQITKGTSTSYEKNYGSVILPNEAFTVSIPLICFICLRTIIEQNP